MTAAMKVLVVFATLCIWLVRGSIYTPTLVRAPVLDSTLLKSQGFAYNVVQGQGYAALPPAFTRIIDPLAVSHVPLGYAPLPYRPYYATPPYFAVAPYPGVVSASGVILADGLQIGGGSFQRPDTGAVQGNDAQGSKPSTTTESSTTTAPSESATSSTEGSTVAGDEDTVAVEAAK